MAGQTGALAGQTPDRQPAGRPDGAAVDARSLYVAMYEGAQLLDSPHRGVAGNLPCRNARPCCFGSGDLRTLYVTTARQKRWRSRLARYPQSGCVFFTWWMCQGCR
jgi:sugar lactone lactonase YvrE